MDTYSFTQISHYLGCPKRYEYRYVDGWREKPARAALHFGRPHAVRGSAASCFHLLTEEIAIEFAAQSSPIG